MLSLVLAPSTHVIMLGVLVVGLVLVILGLLSALAGDQAFLLEPRRYMAWLRVLGPYEPETFWEQTGHHIASRVAGTGVLVLSAVIGALFGSQVDTSRTIVDAWTLIGWLLLIGIPLWWTAFLVRLASQHRRAIKRGALPVRHPDKRFQLLPLFIAYWVVGFATASVVWWIVSRYLQAMYGIDIA
ncbi:hypothetical protein [Promicromonospora sp. NPDC057488]|uniref:hypothetical protein n=1 Tax=Promicromonospora sp. NPDC057488 TaxID=3346147 RepID=UPI00366FA75C